MRTPRFWYQPKGFLSYILSPIGKLYATATALRVGRLARYQPKAQVICVGNINAGGTGKTPTTIALAELLKARGHKVVILSKGHGGREQGPHIVDPTADQPGRVGDEPLMMAGFTTTIVAKDRVAGAKLADAEGADVILMDDGFQSPDLTKALSVVVVDARKGFGNGLCIPAGPLREPVERGLQRADLVLSIGTARDQALFAKAHSPDLTATLEPLPTGMPWAGLRAIAFAGIGLPEKFFRTLRQAGVEVIAAHPLGDHEPIRRPVFERLHREAQAQGAQLVTTEKDAIKLPADLRPLALTFPVRLVINDQDPLDHALRSIGL